MKPWVPVVIDGLTLGLCWGFIAALWNWAKTELEPTPTRAKQLFTVQALLALTLPNVLVWCAVHYRYWYFGIAGVVGSFVSSSLRMTPEKGRRLFSLFYLSAVLGLCDIILPFFDPERIANYLSVWLGKS